MKQKRHDDVLEKAVEAYLVKEVKKLGGMSLKWPAIAQKGVPDRICIFPGIGVKFIEVKRTHGTTTQLQDAMMAKIVVAGGDCAVVKGKDGVDGLIERVKELIKQSEAGVYEPQQLSDLL